MKTKKNKYPEFKGGYSTTHAKFNRIFNIILALVFIIFAIPFFIIIPVIIKLLDKGTVFYTGERLGINKKPFIMYKFRTLSGGAETIIGNTVLSANHKSLVTPIGRFLRDTRLDELPQLFNILKGDMDFVGPRPQRLAVYENLCKDIKGYDRRFRIKPGLLGYPQLFLPHSINKKTQSMVDNILIKKKQKLFWDFYFIAYTILTVLKVSFIRTFKYMKICLVNKLILRNYREKRELARVNLKGVQVFVENGNGDLVFDREVELVDINDEALLVYSNKKSTDIGQNFVFKLEFDYFKRKVKRFSRKSAVCTGKIYRGYKLNNNSDFAYADVVKFTPSSPLSYYMVHQYLLHKSMAGF